MTASVRIIKCISARWDLLCTCRFLGFVIRIPGQRARAARKSYNIQDSPAQDFRHVELFSALRCRSHVEVTKCLDRDYVVHIWEIRLTVEVNQFTTVQLKAAARHERIKSELRWRLNHRVITKVFGFDWQTFSGNHHTRSWSSFSGVWDQLKDWATRNGGY